MPTNRKVTDRLKNLKKTIDAELPFIERLPDEETPPRDAREAAEQLAKALESCARLCREYAERGRRE